MMVYANAHNVMQFHKQSNGHGDQMVHTYGTGSRVEYLIWQFVLTTVLVLGEYTVSCLHIA